MKFLLLLKAKNSNFNNGNFCTMKILGKNYYGQRLCYIGVLFLSSSTFFPLALSLHSFLPLLPSLHLLSVYLYIERKEGREGEERQGAELHLAGANRDKKAADDMRKHLLFLSDCTSGMIGSSVNLISVTLVGSSY